MADAEIVLLVAAGRAERQALDLVRSIRRYLPPEVAVTAVLPPWQDRPSGETVAGLEALGVICATAWETDNRSGCGAGLRAAVMAGIEQQPGPPLLIQADTDTVFTDYGDQLRMQPWEEVLGRPCERKGTCTSGRFDDPMEARWQLLADLCGVDLNSLPYCYTTVDRVYIRQCLDGGFVAARRSSRLFADTAEYFSLMSAHDLLRANWPASRRGSADAALAMAAAKRRVRLLPDCWNVPVTEFHANPVHVHYHRMVEEVAQLTGRAKGAPCPSAA